MMPAKERKVRGRRLRVVGTFVQTCADSGFKGEEKEIILLKNVHEVNGYFSADELWINCTIGFFRSGIDEIEKGDIVEFDGRVKMCKESESDSCFDLTRLLYPTNIKILRKGENDSRAA